jgi:hypothetical protein
MRVKAYVVVHRGYGIAISAGQWPDHLEFECEEYNRSIHGESLYLGRDKERAVVTVTFDLPPDVFKRPPRVQVEGKAVPWKKPEFEQLTLPFDEE